MSKTLSHILTVFKVVRVIAKVVLILCIVGGVGCLIPLVTLPLVDGLLKAQLLGATVCPLHPARVVHRQHIWAVAGLLKEVAVQTNIIGLVRICLGNGVSQVGGDLDDNLAQIDQLFL